jgi:hypothetical protein
VLVPTVAGTVAAYGVSQFGVDMVTTEVVVTRLTDGATLLRTPAATAPLGAEGIETVTALVAAPDGDVAWISSSGQIINPQRLIEVVRRDANGEAVLDSHAGIVTNSLHLRGSTLSWSDGAGAQTAPLN